MLNPNENIENLLSGMLDGMLSEADSAVLRAEMEKDPAVKANLDRITQIRQNLQMGRSRAVLGKDFADRISVAAQKRAIEMVVAAPAWVSPAAHLPKIQSSANSAVWQRRKLLVASACALAATALVALLAIPNSRRSEIVSVPEVPNLTKQTAENSSAANSPINPESTASPQNQRDSNTSIGSQLATSKASEPEVFAGVASNTQNRDREIATGPLANESAYSFAITPREAAVPTISKPAQSNEITPNAQKLFFTTVMDVSIDPLAIENRVLEKILESHRIVYTDDLAVSETQLRNLEDSKLVGNVANTEEKMGVMFLRSSASQLDLAMRDIINRFEDFPEFALDVTTDPAAKLLIDQLSSIKVADGTSGFATTLSLQNTGFSKRETNFSLFTASVRRPKPMANASREKYRGGLIPPNRDRDEMSSVLLLLRPIAK